MALSIRLLEPHNDISPTHLVAVCDVSTPLATWSKALASSPLTAGISDRAEGVDIGVWCLLCVVLVVATGTS